MLSSSLPSATEQKRIWIALCALVLLLFSVAFLNTAWVAEDAFITFRSIDNALNGLGLTWNPGERVQVYTHTLWFFLLIPFSSLTFGDLFYAAILLSYSLLIATVSCLLFMVSQTKFRWLALVPICALLASRSFIDYSSSGLENPLSHFLIVIFAYFLLYSSHSKKTLILSLLTSALFLTRPDAILLIAPALLIHLWQTKNWPAAFLGALPAILWICFSLFYYGAPVPNTAIAKVATGKSFIENATQALNYIVWTLDNDPLTAGLVVLACILGISSRQTLTLAIGLPIWVLYLFYVGADYMGGRFFSVAATASVVILIFSVSKLSATLMAGIILASLGSIQYTLLSPSNIGNQLILNSGIADERLFYYQTNSLKAAIKQGSWLNHPWLLEGLALRQNPGWYTRCTVGMTPFTAGPELHWIDPLALTEPFLARLPARKDVRVGHYERAFPEGYLESMITGTNQIADPALRALYDDVNLAVRAPLLESNRLGAIWRLNTGFHAQAAVNFDPEAIGLPNVPMKSRTAESCLGIPNHRWDISWHLSGPPVEARAMALQAQ